MQCDPTVIFLLTNRFYELCLHTYILCVGGEHVQVIRYVPSSCNTSTLIFLGIILSVEACILVNPGPTCMCNYFLHTPSPWSSILQLIFRHDDDIVPMSKTFIFRLYTFFKCHNN